MVRGSVAFLLVALACSRSPESPTPRSGTEDGRAAPPASKAEPSPAGPAASKVDPRLVDVPAEVSKGIELVKVLEELERPVGLEVAPGDRERLFVVEQVGRIRIARPSKGWALDDQPFYDIRGKVSRANEQGLLGLAFHPQFDSNRKLYINYTDRRGTTMVVEYRTDSSGSKVDMSSARTILRLGQPYSNHNGGDLEFGPDGKLYVGTGDGGAAGDPHGAGQDRNNLLGKMLRFDVDQTSPKPEIVASGLRNPWRYTFDPDNGDIYIADVGQNKWEEVNVVAAGELEGKNFGWNAVEGNHCFKRRGCDRSKFEAPVVEYDHNTGCSITGGYVYRAKALPQLDGMYFYADYCTATIRSFRWSKAGIRDHYDWKPVLDPRYRLATLSSFAVDADGELYVLSLDGPIYKIAKR
ncbi:MAG: PQQ-dependent sugar dehydrogenase [Deltaproteobacteria bacterium]|nr:PQQ-dependent sugar dehydrogenase [Deltaproteobacteria bacterium]